MSDVPGPIDVRVPAQAACLHILRAVAAAVAARLDMPVDAIEELRISVDEAATILLRTTERSTTLHLRLEPEGEQVRIQLASDGDAAPWPPDALSERWPWLVLTGLMDDVDLAQPGPPSVRFRTRGPATAT